MWTWELIVENHTSSNSFFKNNYTIYLFIYLITFLFDAPDMSVLPESDRVSGFLKGDTIWPEAVITAFMSPHTNLWGKITICAVFDKLEGLPENQSIFKKMLTEEMASDLTIVAANGVKIKCHRCFLIAQSPVMAAMFESDMKEAATNTIEMPEIQEASLRAFLRYLYYGDTTEAEDSCAVALEMMELGHKYNVEDLEKCMRNILMKKPFEWFNAKCAFLLFLFARNLQDYTNLKLKAVQVLKMLAAK